MAVSVDHVARLQDLDLAQWDALAGPGDFYVSSAGLRTYEELYPREAGYLRAVDGGRTVAALAWYRLDKDSRPSPFTRPDRLLGRLLEASGHYADGEHLTPLLPAMLCGGRQPRRGPLACGDSRRGLGACSRPRRRLAVHALR